MNWKEFFKPALGKIILFLIIFILFVPFIRYDNGIRCNIPPCPAASTGSAAMWLLFLLYAGAGNIYDIYYSYLIIGFTISYFVSSFVIFTFNKISKKKT